MLGNRGVQTRLLRTFATLFPAHVAPIIIADSGFKVPFYREVGRLGWRWVSCRSLFRSAAATPTSLDLGDWVRINRILAAIGLVRRAPKGRRGNNAFGKRSRSRASQHSARAAKKPWLLVASPKLADLPVK